MVICESVVDGTRIDTIPMFVDDPEFDFFSLENVWSDSRPLKTAARYLLAPSHFVFFFLP